MAPFPESEDMTIKRLKVALRKNDFQLLKMGTYKLHEKFHTGYDFEMTEELREILNFVEQKNIPPEISDILCTTIKEILSKKAIRELTAENQILPNDSGKNELPSSLNSVKIEPVQINLQEIKSIETPRNSYYDLPNAAPASRPEPVQQTIQQAPQPQPVQQTLQQVPIQRTLQQQPIQQTTVQTPPPAVPSAPAPAPKATVSRPHNIVVFYDDFKNDIDFSRVKDYKNNLNLLFSRNENGQDYNILKQISNLTQLLDTDVEDIDKIVSMLTTAKGKVSFVSASQSQNVSRILCEKNVDFEIPFVKKPKDKNLAFDLIPMTGFTNLFVCSNCNMKTLKTDFDTRTLSVQCPHCDSAAFPDIYAINSYNPDCNPVFWHRAFAAFMKSEVWILINPPLDENKEIIFDFLKTAYEAKTPEKVYILSRENDKKEFYRQTFKNIDQNCIVKTSFLNQDKLCEDFINEEVTKKVFA